MRDPNISIASFQIVQQSNELVDIQRKQDKVRDIAASLIYKDPSKV